MIEDENELFASEPLDNGAAKARAAHQLKRELRKAGVFPPKIDDTVKHELDHALADRGKRGRFRIVKKDGLIVPSYQTEGHRSAQEKKRIAHAPHEPSPTDLEIARNARGRGFLEWLASFIKK